MKTQLPLDLKTANKAISDAITLVSLRGQWAAHSSVLSEKLGSRFRGPNTGWTQVLTDLADTRDLLARPDDRAFSALLRTSPADSGLVGAVDHANVALAELREVEVQLSPSSDPQGATDQLVDKTFPKCAARR